MQIICEDCGNPVDVPLKDDPYESGDELGSVVCKNCDSLIKVHFGLFITYQSDYHPVNEGELDELLNDAIPIKGNGHRLPRIQNKLLQGIPGITCPETVKMSQVTFAAQQALQDINPENIDEVKELFLSLYATGVPSE